MRFLIFSSLIFLMSGCATIQSSLPTVLTSKEQQWTIPKGTPFKAIQKPAFPSPTEFVVADDDLAVIYKGNLLALEEEANQRVVKATRSAATKGAAMGIGGSLLSAIAGGIWYAVRRKKLIKVEANAKVET